MSNALGLLIFAFYVTSVIAVAAGVTWIVVRLTPGQNPGSAKRSS